MLVERGKLDLDTRPDGTPYNLRQLLKHTAGLPDYGRLREYHEGVAADAEPWPEAKLLAAAQADDLLFAPDQGWSYSNIGYMLARRHIEASTGRGFSSLFAELIAVPLKLESVELAATREQFSRIHWSAARRYHPGWVYHGCLIGTARDAAYLLHAVFSGELLTAETLRQMLDRRHLGAAVENRPWEDCGYGLGLMSGSMGRIGRAMGHSGGGAFSVNAVYHFPDRDFPITVASFSEGNDEAVPEFETVRLGLSR